MITIKESLFDRRQQAEKIKRFKTQENDKNLLQKTSYRCYPDDSLQTQK